MLLKEQVKRRTEELATAHSTYNENLLHYYELAHSQSTVSRSLHVALDLPLEAKRKKQKELLLRQHKILGQFKNGVLQTVLNLKMVLDANRALLH